MTRGWKTWMWALAALGAVAVAARADIVPTHVVVPGEDFYGKGGLYFMGCLQFCFMSLCFCSLVVGNRLAVALNSGLLAVHSAMPWLLAGLGFSWKVGLVSIGVFVVAFWTSVFLGKLAGGKRGWLVRPCFFALMFAVGLAGIREGLKSPSAFGGMVPHTSGADGGQITIWLIVCMSFLLSLKAWPAYDARKSGKGT